MPRALRTCCELLRRWRRGGFSPWPGPRRKPLGGALAGAGTGGEGGAGGGWWEGGGRGTGGLGTLCLKRPQARAPASRKRACRDGSGISGGGGEGQALARPPRGCLTSRPDYAPQHEPEPAAAAAPHHVPARRTLHPPPTPAPRMSAIPHQVRKSVHLG